MLGIDPGSLVTGFGVIDGDMGRIRHVASGAIRTDTTATFPERLKSIYDGLTEVIKKYQPQGVAVESIFYARNAQSALKLGHARGVALLAGINAGLPIAEYLPTEVKKAVVGTGRADKEQVQRMVRMLVPHKGERGYDASDALAVAICHFYTFRMTMKLKQQEEGR